MMPVHPPARSFYLDARPSPTFFGMLLMTGVDWLGPNEAWERQSMQLMAEEVMPRFRRHAVAQAAV